MADGWQQQSPAVYAIIPNPADNNKLKAIGFTFLFSIAGCYVIFLPAVFYLPVTGVLFYY